jgi:hypothetical protein
MTVRRIRTQRVGSRRIGADSGSGLPYATPLAANALLRVNATATQATSTAGLLYDVNGDGTLAVLADGTSYTNVTDQAALTIKKNSGRRSLVLDAGGAAPNTVELRNGGGGTRDAITSTNVNGFQVGGNVGGFNNSGLFLDPGNPGFATITVTTDQLFLLAAGAKVGFFGATPVGARTKTTPGPAGGTYNATAQAMINDCFNTLKGLGLLV